jgi:ribosomal protein S18 acetylase RimI-like enzyme
MHESTDDLRIARKWAAEILGEKNPAKYYMSEENFVVAYNQDGAFSFFVTGESFYGHLYSTNSYFDARCKDLAVINTAEFHRPDFEIRGGGFHFWEKVTHESGASIELLMDLDEINEIIDTHAPDSSVRPGDSEEIFWGGIRNHVGELVACAVVVKWQSGFHVMASVVTRSQDRGRGYATALSEGMATQAWKLHIPRLGLGVRTSNVAAQRAYEKAGFKKIGVFTNYSRE